MFKVTLAHSTGNNAVMMALTIEGPKPHVEDFLEEHDLLRSYKNVEAQERYSPRHD